VPGVVAAPALSVSVELLPAVTDTGLNDADAPAGSPLAERLTVCALPLVTAVEIVLVLHAARPIVTLFGLAEIEKSLGTGAVTVKETVVVCVADGAVPVTVTV